MGIFVPNKQYPSPNLSLLGFFLFCQLEFSPNYQNSNSIVRVPDNSHSFQTPVSFALDGWGWCVMTGVPEVEKDPDFLICGILRTEFEH